MYNSLSELDRKQNKYQQECFNVCRIRRLISVKQCKIVFFFTAFVCIILAVLFHFISERKDQVKSWMYRYR